MLNPLSFLGQKLLSFSSFSIVGTLQPAPSRVDPTLRNGRFLQTVCKLPIVHNKEK